MGTKDLTTKDARFDTRLSKTQKDLFEEAARLGGFRNLTDFVIVAVQEKANEILSEQERIIVSQRDSEVFFNAVFNPQSPNEELTKAAKEYNALNSQ